jgi:L-idonate 5-dehydrogenase
MIREIQYLGSFRYTNVYDEAIRLVTAGRVQVQPLISRVFPLAEAGAAMAQAFDKDRVIKVQLAINQESSA